MRKENIVVKKIEKNHKKNCDKDEELKAKISIATTERYVAT